LKIGALRIEMLITEGNSLKDKRRILNRLKARVKNKFNVSIAEVDDMDKWRKTVIGIAAVSNGKDHLSSYLDNIMNFIRGETDKIRILDYSMEIM